MRRERERELVIISKYRKSWRVASKKRRSKTFFTAETNVCLDRPLILLLRISCAHTKGTHTHTHTHTYYYRSVYRGSFSRKLMHGLRKFYSNLIVGRNGARAFEIRKIRVRVFPRRKRLRYTRITSLWDRRLLSRINVTLSLFLSQLNFIGGEFYRIVNLRGSVRWPTARCEMSPGMGLGGNGSRFTSVFMDVGPIRGKCDKVAGRYMGKFAKIFDEEEIEDD